MKKLMLLVSAFAGLVLPARAIMFTSLPASVASGQTYTVSALHSCSGSTTYAQMQILKNGGLFMGSGGSGTNYVVTASNTSTDTGPQTISYVANITVTPIGPGSPQTYSTSGSVNIASANHPPTITWVQAPANVTVNQYFVIQARGNDPDGNLTNVFVWREWTPFAFDPGGNGYESYSDANGYSQATPGTVTFMAQAQDSNGATSPVIYTTVNITNNAPTVTASAGNIYAGQTATVSWSAGDPDGNFSYANAWVTQWGSPYWDDLGSGGATGTKSWSSSANFSSNNPASSTYLFVVRAVDAAGAFTDTYAPFDIINRAPYNASITASVNGTNIADNYHIWLGDQLNLSATLNDDDGNLVNHGVYEQRTTQTSPDPSLWLPVGDGTPSNDAVSIKNVSFTPNQTGRWDFHTDGHDASGAGPAYGGASITIYVYGSTNDAQFQSQTVPTTMTTGESYPVSITMANGGASNRPWVSDSDPHELTSVTGVNWGVSAVPLPGGTTIYPPPQTPNAATFTFNVTAPTVPGTYAFQWKMRENFAGNPSVFGTPSTVVNIVVTDNDLPSVPGGFSTANITPTSFTLNWSPSTDNSGAISLYEVYKDGALLGTTAGPSYNVSGLASNTSYNMTVRARDAAGNWSALNSPAYPVTTALDPNGDLDGDGMTNGWEQAHFGSATAGDPNGDPDGDGFTNVAEFNLGKDPNVYDAGTSAAGNSATPGGWPNSGTNTLAVGATAGQLTVDKSGALTYSIPLWTTPGTAGMEPKLALNYSSQAGNGIAGMGWSLSGTSAITRGGRTRAIDGVNQGVTFTANDRFYLDGQRLVLVPNTGAYGAANSEYRTELDSFTKIIAYGSRGTGPAYFKAWTKAGLIIEFGNTGDSAYDGWGHPEAFSWSVNKISDTMGNYMSYSYEKEAVNGIQRLTRIDYTGNVAAPYASLRFEYEARNDTFFGYPSGATVSNLKRLKTVKSYYGETVAHTYTLNYTERAAAAARTLLTSITETGSDGLSYPDLVFDYETPTGGWAASGFFSPPTYPYLLPPQFFAQQNVVTGAGMMDLNGDGYPDFVRKKMSNAGEIYNDAYLNTAAGFVDTPAMRLPGSGATLAWDNKQDAGCRFIDVNGDGYVDALLSLTSVSYATHNTGTGWDYNLLTATPAGFAFALDTSKVDSGRRIVDINGDGLPDIVWNTSATDNGCYINNFNGQYQTGGPAWVSAPQWAPPFAIMANVSSGSQFFDVNGDGLPDLVQLGCYSSMEAGIALNSPTGFGAQNTTWKRVTAGLNSSYASLQASLGALGKYLPPCLLSEDGSGWQVNPIGTEVVDLNGDGLPDVIFSNPKMNTEISLTLRTAGAWLNTGNGWVAAPAYTPLVALRGRTDGSELDGTGAVFGDLNGDGLVDLAMYRSDQSSVYYLNTGHGWGAQNTSYQLGLDFSLPVAVANANAAIPTGFQLIDLNADGVMDLVANNNFRYNLAKPTADKLIKVTNGLGVAASISYATLTERDMSGNGTVYTKGSGSTFPVADVTGPMLVVKTVNNDDGVGGQYPVTYKYQGLRSDLVRGSLGFSDMFVTDGRTGIQTQTTFAQTYPYIGMPVETKTTSGTTVLSDTLVSYGNISLNGGASKFVYAADSFTTTHDLDGTLTGTVDTAVAGTDIDAYGNILKITVDTDGYTKTTTSIYTNDTTHWFLGRLSSATVVSAGPSLPSITRTSSFTYNAAGLLENETVEAGNDNLSVTTSHSYDQFGNQNSVTVAGAGITVANDGTVTTGPAVARPTSTNYDSYGRFPISTTNALLHSETYDVYDQVLGVLKQMTGANGLVTTWDYDGMGRKIHEHRADGTDSYTNYRWVSSAPSQAEYYGGAPAAKYLVENTASGSAPTLAFYDAFGRAYLSLGIAGDGRIIYQTTQYDAQGRAFAKSVPYFASPNGQPHAYWATTGFDLLNRPITVTTPDEEAAGGQVTSSSGYSGLQATATDPKGRVARTIKNSQGWTIQNTRNENAAGGATASTVTYGYDALGNLTSTTADGATTTLGYDLRGRKTSMVDPDMGTWQYRYNIFGELIWQKDAKGQITTMVYDALGRMTSRVEAEGTTTWTYDTAAKPGGTWKGKLASVSSPGGYLETYDYDSLGRPATVWRTIPGVTNTTLEPRFFVTQTYDTYGRPEKTIYPTGFQTINLYNGFGYLKEVRRADSNRNDVYWMADTYSVTGRVNGEYYGNGLINDRVYSDATGRLRTAAIGKGTEISAPFSIQYLQYHYDGVGNVTSRSDDPTGRAESFGYDGLDRLLTHVLNGYPTVSVTYNANGNIASKSDVGNYAYTGTGPHALSGISGGALGTQSYTYDANGNMQGGGGRTITWTSFNQVQRVQNSGNTIFSEFTFGASHERIKEVAHNATTVFIGSLFERVTSGSLIENKHYIFAPTGRIAVRTERNDTTVDTRYFHTDGLGSITAVTNEAGQIVKRFAFDAWGKRLDPSTNGVITSSTSGKFTRGFTDHEQLDDLGLIHMNGRIYDPVLGRFLSADPNVDGVSDAQGYNRYSYVGNNPLGATDPTGFFSFKDIGGAIVGIVVAVVVVVAIVYSGGAFASFGSFFSSIAPALAHASLGELAIAGAAGGFASGFSGSLLNGASLGDAFRSGLIGAATGAATAWAAGVIGHEFGAIGSKGPWNEVGRALAHGAAGGAITEASGGQFRHGFYAGFAGSAAGSLAPSLHLPAYDIRTGSAIAERTAFAAVVGGTASVLGGGKFANGAVTSAFEHLFNAETNHQKTKPFKVTIYDNKDFDHMFADTPDFKAAAERYGELPSPINGASDIFSIFNKGDDYDSVAVFAHGGFGVQWLTKGVALTASCAEWLAIAQSVNPNGDIYLFGCNVCGGSDNYGENYVQNLANAAQRRVHATNDFNNYYRPTGQVFQNYDGKIHSVGTSGFKWITKVPQK